MPTTLSFSQLKPATSALDNMRKLGLPKMGFIKDSYVECLTPSLIVN